MESFRLSLSMGPRLVASLWVPICVARTRDFPSVPSQPQVLEEPGVVPCGQPPSPGWGAWRRSGENAVRPDSQLYFFFPTRITASHSSESSESLVQPRHSVSACGPSLQHPHQHRPASRALPLPWVPPNKLCTPNKSSRNVSSLQTLSQVLRTPQPRLNLRSSFKRKAASSAYPTHTCARFLILATPV